MNHYILNPALFALDRDIYLRDARRLFARVATVQNKDSAAKPARRGWRGLFAPASAQCRASTTTLGVEGTGQA
ncbi:MAG: hypothetical protein WEB00_06000 [Dehalococcoidia bacterium]